jgi:methyl-accepting chemotaxis protein
MQGQRKRIVINRALQYREAVVAASVTVLSVNLVVIVGTLFPGSFGIAIDMSPRGYWSVAALGLALLAGVALLSIRRSHAVAGPVYAIAREVSKLARGDLSFRIRLRPGDAFMHEAGQINTAASQLGEQLELIKELVQAMQGARSDEELQQLLTVLATRVAMLTTRSAAQEPDHAQ